MTFLRIHLTYLLVLAWTNSLYAAPENAATEKLLREEGELSTEETLTELMTMDAKRAESLGATAAKLAGMLKQAMSVKGSALTYQGQSLTVKKSKSSPPRKNFFSPTQKSASLYQVTDPESKESIAFGPQDVEMIEKHGYYPKCCKPDRILVVFENPRSLQTLKAKLDAKNQPVEKRVRPPIVAEEGEFSIGGVNGSASILALTELNRIPLAEIETRLRKGPSPWLGPNEQLRDLLRQDNELVHTELKVTHQMLAGPLESLSSRGKLGETKELTYKGLLYTVRIKKRPPPIESAFGEEPPDDRWVTIVSKAGGHKIEYPKAMEMIIWRYGFYGGHGSPRRIDPRKIAQVFTDLKP